MNNELRIAESKKYLQCAIEQLQFALELVVDNAAVSGCIAQAQRQLNMAAFYIKPCSIGDIKAGESFYELGDAYKTIYTKKADGRIYCLDQNRVQKALQESDFYGDALILVAA